MGVFDDVLASLSPVAGVIKGSKDKRKAEEKAFQEAEKLRQEGREREARLIEASALTAPEQRREEEAFALERRKGKELERRAGLPGEDLLRETGGISQSALDRTQELVDDPTGGFESVLAEELELARQFVNQQANRRGVFGGKPAGGIRFEQLGRAGIDLAIKSARERLAARNSAIDRAFQVTQEGLRQGQIARGEEAQFLSGQQSLSQRGRERAVAGTESALGFGERGGVRGSGITTDILGGRIQEGAELQKSSAQLIQQVASGAAGGGGGGSFTGEGVLSGGQRVSPSRRVGGVSGSSFARGGR